MKISKKLNYNPWFKLIIFIPLFLALYFVLLQYAFVGNFSATLREPVCLKTFVDNLIQFNFYFIFPYLLWLLFPIAGIFFVFYRKISVVELLALYLAHILLLLSSYLFYLILPTTAGCVMINSFDPTVLNEGMFEVIQSMYTSSTPFNAFPSYHVTAMVFLSIFLYKRWRFLFWVSLPLAFLISIATVFVKFHVFVDILGGIVMGIFGYYILYEKVALKYLKKIFN